MEHQWIQWYNEWNPTEVNVNEWNTSNSILYWIILLSSVLNLIESNCIHCFIDTDLTEFKFNYSLKAISANSMSLNTTSVNQVLNWKQFHLIQCYCIESLCFKCYIDWKPTELNIIEWNQWSSEKRWMKEPDMIQDISKVSQWIF